MAWNPASEQSPGVQQQTTQDQSGTVTSNESTSQRTSQAGYQQNFTGSSLSALENLIATLSDRPRISDEEASAKYPSLVPVYTQQVYKASGPFGTGRGGSSGGLQWKDPLTGQVYQDNDQRVQQLQADRAAQRKKFQESGGIVKGGTAEMQASSEARNKALSTLTKSQGDYTKNAAFLDSQALIQQVTRQLLEQTLPQITRSAEGAGSSQNSVRTLLINDAAARTAENAGALGVKTAVEYGGIQAQLASVLDSLSKNNPVTEALLAALGTAKGAVNSSAQVSSTKVDSSKTVTSDQSTTTDQTVTPLSRKQTQTQQAPAGSDLIRIVGAEQDYFSGVKF